MALQNFCSLLGVWQGDGQCSQAFEVALLKFGVLKLLGRVQALATLPDIKETSERIMGYDMIFMA